MYLRKLFAQTNIYKSPYPKLPKTTFSLVILAIPPLLALIVRLSKFAVSLLPKQLPEYKPTTSSHLPSKDPHAAPYAPAPPLQP